MPRNSYDTTIKNFYIILEKQLHVTIKHQSIYPKLINWTQFDKNWLWSK